jgi:acyl CoA:acetate/3-ketoacid CoA transferase alpha subunit
MERKQKLATLNEVLPLIGDGITLAIGGYLNNNHPMALIRGIVRRG